MGNPRESPAVDRRRTLRVTIVSRIYRPEASAASLRLGALADALRSRGHDTRVLTSSTPRETRGRDHEPRVSRWPVLRDRAGYVRGYMQYMSFDLPLFIRVLFGRPTDVYVCEPPPTTGAVLRIATMLRRTPYVYYAADIWSDAVGAMRTSGIVPRVVRALERFALRGADEVLAVTEGVRSRIADLAPGVGTTVVGHGVDLSRFAADGDVVEEPADIVYVGSASEWHGAELAVEALDAVMRDDETLTAAFVGQGTSWPGMQREVDRRGLSSRVRFVDTVSPERAAGWLRGARVSLATLVPGKGYDFAVPTKLYASVAVGTPVVYAGPPGIGEVINGHRLGIAVAYEAAAFADALREALRTADGSANPELVSWAESNLAATNVAGLAVAAIDEVVGRRDPARRKAPGTPQ